MKNYKDGDICYRCMEDGNVTVRSVLCPGNALVEKDKYGEETGRRICCKHRKRDYDKYSSNSMNSIMKSIRNYNTGNQDICHSSTSTESGCNRGR